MHKYDIYKQMTEAAPHFEDWATNTEQTAELIEFPRLPIFPRAENYARLPFQQAFDVPAVLEMSLAEKQLPLGHAIWLVDFASHRKPSAVEETLNSLDAAAHREAQLSPDFLLYFRGEPDAQGYCRSFCTWAAVQSAKLSSAKKHHSQAARSVDQFYNWYQVKSYEAQLDNSQDQFKLKPRYFFSSDGRDHLVDA